MKAWLNNIYITPQSKHYLIFSFLLKYKKRLMMAAMLMINSYSIVSYVYYEQQVRQYEQQMTLLNEEISQNEKRLNILMGKKADNQAKDNDFTEINRKIKQVIAQHNAKVEQIKWEFEQGKQINLVLSQSSSVIFNLIEALEKLNALYFNELLLFKLHQDRLIQLQADLTFE